MLTLSLAIGLASLILYVIHLARNANKYWERRGIKSLKPLLFFGNSLPIWLNKKNMTEIYCDLQRAFPNEQITGFYDNLKPRLIIQDPDYIEKVIIKDFAHFTDLGSDSPDEKKRPIDHYQLFSMRGTKWRAFRYKMTPLFTSGKLKQMFQTYETVGEELMKHIQKKQNKEIVFREVMHLYAMDFVGLAVFGLNPSCLENPGSEFHRMAARVFDISYFKLVFATIFPSIFIKLGISFNNKEAVAYFCKIIGDAFDYRQKNDIKRNDFIQMMIQLKEKGKIEVQKWDPNDDYLKKDDFTPTESFEITDMSLMSQAYTFLTTGLDGVAITTMMGFYHLSLHQDIQTKAREEILEQIKTHSGLTYDALKNMSYLEKIVNEILRVHPLAQGLTRVCTKDYTFPNGYTMKVGEELQIPHLALHLNPDYHTDPMEFKPERFDYPMKTCTYLPFGDGPRVCIAMRFALLQIKYGLAKILSNYIVKLNPKTVTPLKMKPQGLIYEPIQTLYFDLEKV